MDESLNAHLSRIETRWTLLRQAHEASGELRQASQESLLNRYHRAASRYLLAMTRNPELAEELFQDFAVRFLRGDFRGANPEKGRFRAYLKSSLVSLHRDYFRRQRKGPSQEPLAGDLADRLPEDADLDEGFDQSWRDELIQCAWNRLQGIGQQAGQPFFEILQLRSSNPELNSGGLAASLNAKLETAGHYNAGSVRKLLQRAREKFAEALLEEVAESLGTRATEPMEEELINSGLHAYCKPALDRWR